MKKMKKKMIKNKKHGWSSMKMADDLPCFALTHYFQDLHIISMTMEWVTSGSYQVCLFFKLMGDVKKAPFES